MGGFFSLSSTVWFSHTFAPHLIREEHLSATIVTGAAAIACSGTFY